MQSCGHAAKGNNWHCDDKLGHKLGTLDVGEGLLQGYNRPTGKVPRVALCGSTLSRFSFFFSGGLKGVATMPHMYKDHVVECCVRFFRDIQQHESNAVMGKKKKK